MRKLYIFGDSFSMITEDLSNSIFSRIENNSHSSLSNDHIIKFVKLKILKLIKNNEFANILVQLTTPNRLLVNYNSKFPEIISNLQALHYNHKILFNADKEIFEPNRYISLYPFFGSHKDDLIKNLYVPYTDYIINGNYLNLLRDWILELNILKELAVKNNINLEYFFYTNDYDDILKNSENEPDTLNSFHIKFEGFNSLESYLRKTNNHQYFVSKIDKHFNEDGQKWYLKYLLNRYDF
jgi:hypothetical protein